MVTAAGQGESTLLQVTGFSVSSVPPRVHTLGGGEEGPRPVRQQRAPSDGRVSEPCARPRPQRSQVGAPWTPQCPWPHQALITRCPCRPVSWPRCRPAGSGGSWV